MKAGHRGDGGGETERTPATLLLEEAAGPRVSEAPVNATALKMRKTACASHTQSKLGSLRNRAGAEARGRGLILVSGFCSKSSGKAVAGLESGDLVDGSKQFWPERPVGRRCRGLASQ